MRALLLTPNQVEALAQVLSPVEGEDLTAQRDLLIGALGRASDDLPVSAANVAAALQMVAGMLDEVPPAARRHNQVFGGLMLPSQTLLNEAGHLEAVARLATELRP